MYMFIWRLGGTLVANGGIVVDMVLWAAIVAGDWCLLAVFIKRVFKKI